MIDNIRLPVKGSVSIKVVKDSRVLSTVTNSNVVVIDLLRVVLAQLVPKGTSQVSSISKTDRPTIYFNNVLGPDNTNSLAYIKAGYSADGSSPNTAVSKLDTAMFKSTYDILKVSECIVTDTSITLVAKKSITSLDASKFYVEVGLFTPGSSNTSIPDSPNESSMRLVAHQLHSALQAPSGASIEYEWTLIFQEQV